MGDCRPVQQTDLNDALRQMLLAKQPAKPRDKRQPTKAGLETRYWLDRR